MTIYFRQRFALFLAMGMLLGLSASSSSIAQSKEVLRKGLQRGWSDEQVHVWDDYMTEVSKRSFTSLSQADCEDFTFRRDALLNGNRIT
ncbi:MAG: hypothetical protein WBW88_12205, partial [Rhodothermales bacterium]